MMLFKPEIAVNLLNFFETFQVYIVFLLNTKYNSIECPAVSVPTMKTLAQSIKG